MARLWRGLFSIVWSDLLGSGKFPLLSLFPVSDCRLPNESAAVIVQALERATNLAVFDLRGKKLRSSLSLFPSPYVIPLFRYWPSEYFRPVDLYCYV